MRSPVTLLLLLGLLSAGAVRSQSDELMIQGQTGKFYLVHIVAAKETWYSIGRMYNEPPKAITDFNKLTMNKPLEIGQQIEIPLTATNFSQNGQKAANETLVPVYHIVQEKEWMYRISINHNKVPIPSLEKWNHIKKDQVKAGMHMVVGFLKVKTALSALAKATLAPSAASTIPASNIPASVASTPAPVASTPAPVASTPLQDNHSVTKTTPKKADSVKGDEKLPMTSQPVSAPVAALHYNGGFFRADFYDGGRMANGLAGTFKSSSGWQDGKYYALMNNVPVGTIVKITDAVTAKSIFAKVLGQLPDMKESAGLSIRISNAAASELGSGDGRFNVEMKY